MAAKRKRPGRPRKRETKRILLTIPEQVLTKLLDPRRGASLSRATESYRGDEKQLPNAARYVIGELFGLPTGGIGKVRLAANTDGALSACALGAE